MKLNENTEAILGNAGSTSKFKIAASAKAFKVLSSGLYKNKIRAIVRELSCNAVDAHKLNGSTDAFEIKAPTQLDPRFIIRDFGPGLNEEDVTNLYSTYFASTKSSSNDFIGALGLGSKSPFSYTDTFTVVSYNGGMVQGFTAMLDGGEPALRKVFEEPMKEGEKNGIEITVPVKLPDIQRWQQEIRYVLRTFSNWPHVIKGTSAPNYFPVREGKNQDWFTANSDEGYGLFAVYGNIVYPLNDVPGLKQSWMQINHSSVYIHFDLGELDIAASREELSLDEDTIANIIARVDSISKVEMASTIKELQAITNERELLRRLDDMNRSAVNCIINAGTQFASGLSIDKLKTKYTPPESLIDVGAVYDIAMDTRLKRIKDPSRYSYTRFQGYNTKELFGYHNDEVIILIDDKSSKRVKAIRAMSLDSNFTNKKVVVYKADDEDQMEAFDTVKALFGDDTVIVKRVSECDDIIAKLPESNSPKEKRPASPNVTTYTFNSAKGYHEVESFRMTSDELKELDGYVILRKRDDFHDHKTGESIVNMNEHTFNTLIKALKIKELHVIRSTVVDRINKYDNVDSLIDFITEKVIDLVDSVDYDEYVGSPDYSSSRIVSMCQREPKLNFILNYFTTSGKNSDKAQVLSTISDHIDWFVTQDDDIRKANKIVKDLKIAADASANSVFAEFKKKNPMVHYMLSNCYSLSDDNMIADIKRSLTNNEALAAS